MMKDKPTYQELQKQIAELKLQNDILRMKSSFQNEEEAKGADELRKAEEREKELKYSQRIARIGYYILDIKKDIWTSSEMLDEIFGIDESFIRNSEGWISLIHPEFKTEMSNYLSINILTKHQEFKKEYKIINKKTNSVIWVHGLGTLEFNTQGELIKMFGTIQDITEQIQMKNTLLENQDRYEKSQSLGHVGNWDYNLESEIFWVSDESKRIYGFNLESNNFSIERVENCIPERERVHQALIDLIERDKKYDLEFEIIPYDKSPRKIIHSIAELERDAFNNPLRVRGGILDITERIKAEQALKENEEKLKIANETKDKFFSIIAHDLKSPFSSLLGFSTMLSTKFDKYDTEKKKKFISIINQGLNETYKLLENLLYWSRLQRGSIEFKAEKLDLNLIYDETRQLLHQSSENKSIKIASQIPENTFVIADKDMLSTTIRNLISNAIKFTPKFGKILIGAEITAENKTVEIFVHDNGIGISKELQAKIFDIGVNTSTKGTENETGTGLGLILCKEFIEKQGGQIWVESEIGKGSDFRFTLPLYKD